MIVFGIYNIVVSTVLIIFSIYFIKQINNDIKEDEEYKQMFKVEWVSEYIKKNKKYKLLNYIVLIISILVILFTSFIFIMEVL